MSLSAWNVHNSTQCSNTSCSCIYGAELPLQNDPAINVHIADDLPASIPRDVPSTEPTLPLHWARRFLPLNLRPAPCKPSNLCSSWSAASADKLLSGVVDFGVANDTTPRSLSSC